MLVVGGSTIIIGILSGSQYPLGLSSINRLFNSNSSTSLSREVVDELLLDNIGSNTDLGESSLDRLYTHVCKVEGEALY